MVLSEAVKKFVRDLSPKEKEVLRRFISLPNSPDIQPEILKLKFSYGAMLTRVSERVEAVRVEWKVSYDVIRAAILEELRERPR